MMSRERRILIALLVGGAAAFWFLILVPNLDHKRWYDRVDTNLKMLADKRPVDVPPGQWEFMVGWTMNLHANCGGARDPLNRPDRAEKLPFLAELERRLQEPVTVATIDWIWDEYGRFTENGRRYGENYRPTRSPELKHAKRGCFGISVSSRKAEPGAPP